MSTKAKNKQKVMNQNDAEPKEVEQTSKLEAIKNLIFGENMAEYDSAFNDLKKDIDAKKEYLENYIDDVRKDLEQHIDSVNTDVNIRITDLETKLEDKANALEDKKVNKKQLSKLLISLGEKIGN